ncbi:hypothetical protein C7974DRAFT_4040 [Boeremia exigua]|uniref:uncharacterized protein n=1 Tax=Boeremia exigua TaxID=749465 RepID=UPI001E8DE3EC|nr:uncharacterized protein C7974DRAFT_4040 [Boeremia exigua]KAH6643721.1 hypothetical protein C7974DRAFT_4040 [Boeremia exigua]
MSDDEQSVARAAISRTLQACQRCRSLKTRCLPSSQPGTCQRCMTGGRECAWADAPRRARKLRAPSRISQVEHKIDGLVASLVNPPATLSKTPVSAPVSEECERPPLLGGDFAPHPSRKGRPRAPGTWLPFPSSFEQQPEPAETPAQQGAEGEDAADRHYIEQIRSIHSFGENDDDCEFSECTSKPSTRREEPIKDNLIDDLVASGEADVLLREYRKMSNSFPFVPLAPDTTVQQLNHDAPMLFLAMITAASWRDHKVQKSLDAIYRQELAHRTIIKPRRNLSLVQSVLVYLSWYHYVFSHKTQQIFFLHHLVIGLALDIGLHRDTRSLLFVRLKKPDQVQPQMKRERQRTFLGCYYLASMLSASMQKPNLLKHNSDMTEWAQELKDYREYPTDEVLGHLISLRQIEDEIQDTLFTGCGADAQLTDTRVVMHMRFLETRLDAWKRDSEGVTCQRMLLLSHAFADMTLHSIALRPLLKSTQPPADNSIHIKALLSALEAGKRFFDTLLSEPASDYYLLSFPEWMRFPAAMMTVARLCIPTDAHTMVGWDVQAAQNLVRLEICLEALCYRFQNLSASDKATLTRPSFWWAMRYLTDLTRTWYVRKLSPQTQDRGSSRPTPNNDTANSLLRLGPGALPTPPDGGLQDHFADSAHTDFGGEDMDIGANVDMGNDPFAFARSADFDMEQFFDMGIWGDEAYHSMGFGDMAF